MSVGPYHEATFQKHCSSRLGDGHCHVLVTCKMRARDQVTRDQMARDPMARDQLAIDQMAHVYTL